MKLLTREVFKEKVLSRDKHECVYCHKDEGIVVHHIIERKLWDDGGYYKDNGASLCPKCHWEAEKTHYSCEKLRSVAGISKVILPPSLGELPNGHEYDKWGNVVMNGDRRVPGPMFETEQVQKVLAGILYLFR